jgi:DNA-directed RNA polymerase subunit L
MAINESIIIFDNETHTIGNLLNNELVDHPNVLFSGYKIIHPLKKQFKLHLQVINDEPKKIIKSTITKIKGNLDKFDKCFSNSF